MKHYNKFIFGCLATLFFICNSNRVQAQLSLPDANDITTGSSSFNAGFFLPSPYARFSVLSRTSSDLWRNGYAVFSGTTNTSVTSALSASPTGNGIFMLYDSTLTNADAEVMIHSAGNSYFNGGYVGLGTTTPSALMHLRQFDNQGIRLSRTGYESIGIHLREYSGNTGLTFFNHTDGLPNLFIKDNGRIGINTTDPTSHLHVVGNAQISWQLLVGTDTERGNGLTIEKNDATLDLWNYSSDNVGPLLKLGKTRGTSPNDNSVSVVAGDVLGQLQFWGSDGGGTSANQGAKIQSNAEGTISNSDVRARLTFFTRHSDGLSERMRITSDGKIGIGTTNPGELLSVNGVIEADEIVVREVEGADFVFEEDYDLRSLEDTEAFIKENKHLPEIPSAAAMAEDGLGLKEMNILLLQKIEEMTLHQIDLLKRVKELEEKLTTN